MSILSHDPVLRHHSRTSPAVHALALAAACAVFIPMDAAAQACTQADQNGCTELSASPPQDTTAIPPNIVLLLDDSGSMQWNYMPDSGYLNYSGTYLINAANNRVYYNPTIEYKAPPKADGVSPYPDITDITDAPLDGFDTSLGRDNITRHAGTQRGYGNSFNFYHSVTTGSGRNQVTRYYFRFAVGPVSSSQTVYYVAPPGQTCGTLTNCYDASHSGSPIAPPGVSAWKNIGNWFSYYRTRILMAKSGLMTAFVDLSPNYRFGFGSLNNTNSSNLPTDHYTSAYTTISNVRPFGDGSSSTNKAQFWKWLETMDPSGGTPLRRALYSAGQYYETAQPWQSMPGDPNYVAGGTNTDELACRASYTILTTDGFWNGADPNVAAMKKATDSDGTTYVDASGATAKYSAVPPFIGGNAVNDGTTANKGTSLADIAAYYWKRDLRPATANLVPTNQNDPAFWQHMTTFTFGIGFEPVEYKNGPVLPMDDIFAWARDGSGTGSAFAIPGFSWPTPSKDNVTNIADMAHAAVVGRGNFFSATNPQELADGFAKAIAQISERNVASPPSSSNASVAVLGALSFKKSYNTRNWEGTLEAVELKPDGRTGDMKWDITSKLDAMTYTSRKIFTPIFTGVTCSGSTSTGAVFDKGIQLTGTSGTQLDCAQRNGLASPAFDATNANDTLQNRIDYILGDASFEGNPYRARGHRLGAILNSSPVYVSYPSASYRNIWPAGSAESIAEINGEGYGKYVMDNAEREGTIYVGANDGMLHAFSSPAPDCDFATDPTNPTCTYGDGGNERWAYVPRAVYANLGNLTDSRTFAFRPTADASPRTRDVYFGGKWRTILVSGVGLGGRGVYALDISDQENFAASDVLWEFNADSAVNSNCKSNSGSCQATDLGYTVPQPNIARLANGKWVVLVPNGYFPDCDMATVPTGEPERSAKPRCTAIAAQAPSNYSALFVLDAQTGAMIAELKTPTNISGVKSYGLGSVVVGDYENNQIDDVAFAGDLMGNLWRFDLTDANPANWKVTLAFKGKDNAGIQGVQPITVMPRLFPDLRSSRFMIVFGTGKYLGPGDNDAGIPVQAIYGIQEQVDTNGNLVPATFAQLRQQTLTEAAGAGDFTGATLRKLTDNALASNHQGWYINLDIAAAKGERVVETPATIFPANTAIFRTLIPSTDNYCDPSTKGAVMSVSAANGGSNGGLSSLGGNDLVGARVSHAATGGTVPAMQSLGGGEIIIPVEIEVGGGVSTTPPPPLKVDSPMWRRRSWSNAETK